MSWPDVACSHCMAEPGQPCRSLVSRHTGRLHAERAIAASRRMQALEAAGIGDLGSARARRAERARLNAQMGARP
jgi:hypothetical protein